MAATWILTEGEAFVLTATVKRDGTGVNLDAYDSVTVQVHDSQAAFGPNQISVLGTPDADQTTNPGVVTFSLTTTHTNLPTGKTDFRGVWCIQCKTTDNALVERTLQGECIILRNPYAVI